jgi:hypothetical protein
MGPALSAHELYDLSSDRRNSLKVARAIESKLLFDLLTHSRLLRGTQYVEHLTTLLYQVSLAIPTPLDCTDQLRGLHRFPDDTTAHQLGKILPHTPPTQAERVSWLVKHQITIPFIAT